VLQRLPWSALCPDADSRYASVIPVIELLVFLFSQRETIMSTTHDCGAEPPLDAVLQPLFNVHVEILLTDPVRETHPARKKEQMYHIRYIRKSPHLPVMRGLSFETTTNTKEHHSPSAGDTSK
jgi:hypothetical protein